MNPLAAAGIVATLTTVGKWSRGDNISIDTILGAVGVAIGLAILAEMNREFSRAMGVLVVVAVLLAQGGSIFEKVKL